MANGYIDALRQAQKTIGTLKQALFGVIALGVVGMLIARQLPVNLSIPVSYTHLTLPTKRIV